MAEIQPSELGEGLRRFKPYPAYKNSGVEWLGEIPAGWEVERWRYCCRVTEGQVPPGDDLYRERILIAPNHIESGTGRILYLETANEQGAVSGKYLVERGDLIYSKIRPALNKACIAEGEWLCSADMYPIKIVSRGVRARFLLYFVLSRPFVRLMVDESMRVAMPKVNRETLAGCPLVVPTSDEQDAIALFLDRETARIDALVTKKERLIELLQEQRTALITRAVTNGLDRNVPIKDSGVEWLGRIPAHWEIVRIKTITAEHKQGFYTEDPYLDDGVKLARITDIDDHAVVSFANMPFVRIADAAERAFSLKEGDFLFARSGTIGRFGVVRQPERAVFASYLIRFRFKRVASEFLKYAFASRAFRESLISSLHGGANQNVHAENIKEQWVAVPPATEQRVIAAFLDHETAKIQALLAKVRAAIERLKELRSALISAAVTGKIDVREEAA